MRKAACTKTIHECIYADGSLWTVQYGELKRHKGRPDGVDSLFRVVAEKLPFDCLAVVKRHLANQGVPLSGVYVAHDSMGVPRYIGRGAIFSRLQSRWEAQPLELTYFSFYVVENKKHEREIETLLIRAAGHMLDFNDRKKRVGISAGDVKDYEPGTLFYERQYKRGRPGG